MSIWKEADGRMRRWGLVDVKLAQMASVFLGLVIAKLFPQVLSVSTGWLVVICLAAGVKPAFDFVVPRRENLPADG